VGRKKTPTVGVFPTVSVFSYGQINPTVKMPRLKCTQFVVPRDFKGFFEIIFFLSSFFPSLCLSYLGLPRRILDRTKDPENVMMIKNN